ncbi:MAG: hypothetical protein IKA12_02950 [Clostridia bacterium]|nr:hypothetical protein [Clostridia bacterium]
MEKLYGYKIGDVNGLINLIKKGEHKTLNQLFLDYSIKSGKSVGTVRNLYYALAKNLNDDVDALNKFSIQKIKINTPKSFSKEDETKLINDVTTLKKQGHSIRNAVFLLANGDPKLALRYQNKYRNCIKNNPKLINESIENSSKDKENPLPKISEFYMTKLKKEINGLVERIAINLTKENANLKKKIGELRLENLKLKTMLFSGNF